jgi:hypothetical protein
MKYFFFLLGVITLIFISIMTSRLKHSSDDYVKMADIITNRVIEKLTKRYNMRVIGLGAGMADAVNIIGISFQIVGPLPKDELRMILVNTIRELLDELNSDEKIRPYLKSYPFTSEGTQIDIFVIDKEGKEVFDPDIGVVGVDYSGRLSFNTTDRNNRFKYKTEEEETYEEALAIVKKQYGENL